MCLYIRKMYFVQINAQIWTKGGGEEGNGINVGVPGLA